MPMLPENTLRYFPVRYPMMSVAAGVAPDRTKRRPRGRRGNCNTIITFGDDFDAARGNSTHHAIDIFGAFDLEIVATRDGTVPQSWWIRRSGRREDRNGVGLEGDTDGGNYVMIQDADGYFHYYAHLSSRPLAKPGQRIRAGQLIGYLGDTGRARTTCQHLHYQVSQRNGGISFFNPYRELRRLAAPLGADVGRRSIRVPVR